MSVSSPAEHSPTMELPVSGFVVHHVHGIYSSADSDDSEPSVELRVALLVAPQSRAVLYANLIVETDEVRLIATSNAEVTGQKDDYYIGQQDTELTELVKRSSGVHVAYDAAAQAIRVLAGLMAVPINVERLTPQFEVDILRAGDGDSDLEDAEDYS